MNEFLEELSLLLEKHQACIYDPSDRDNFLNMRIYAMVDKKKMYIDMGHCICPSHIQKELDAANPFKS